MHWGGESVNKLLMKLISASHSLLWFQTADSLIPKEPRDWDFQKCCWQAGIIVEDQNHKIYKVLQVIIYFAEGSTIQCDFKKIWILSLVHWIFHLNSQTLMFLLRLHEMGPLLQSHVLARSDWSWPQDCSRCWPRTTLVISTLDSSPPINRCSLHFTQHEPTQKDKKQQPKRSEGRRFPIFSKDLNWSWRGFLRQQVICIIDTVDVPKSTLVII